MAAHFASFIGKVRGPRRVGRAWLHHRAGLATTSRGATGAAANAVAGAGAVGELAAVGPPQAVAAAPSQQPGGAGPPVARSAGAFSAVRAGLAEPVGSGSTKGRATDTGWEVADLLPTQGQIADLSYKTAIFCSSQ